jgi:hypothetical protein
VIVLEGGRQEDVVPVVADKPPSQLPATLIVTNSRMSRVWGSPGNATTLAAGDQPPLDTGAIDAFGRGRSRDGSATETPHSCSAWPSTKRVRNSLSTVWSNPGSANSIPSRYFQSILPRTESAA